MKKIFFFLLLPIFCKAQHDYTFDFDRAKKDTVVWLEIEKGMEPDTTWLPDFLHNTLTPPDFRDSLIYDEHAFIKYRDSIIIDTRKRIIDSLKKL